MKISELAAKNGKNIKLVSVALLSLGLILVMLSIVYENSGDTAKETSYTAELSEYSEELSESLKNAVCGIVGSDDVRVMITFESTFESVYYSDAVVNEAVTADKTDRKSEKQLVLTGNMGENQSPVVVKKLSPKPSGAIIVCKGGNDAEIKNRVTELASCALNISKNKIYVTGGN